MKSDRYYGDVARGDDAKRMHKPGWAREQQAVQDFVTKGPVIDVPFGTGRYVDIYKAKKLGFIGVDISTDMIAEALKKHPEANVLQGSVFDLPFDDGHFGTVVCSRLLNWLYPEDMARAVREIRRVGREIVVSIRTGIEGKQPVDGRPRGNYTHRLDTFYAAIDGLFIAERRTISTASDGTFEMFKLRAPCWADVLAQFDQHPDSHDAIKRLSDVWVRRFDMGEVSVEPDHVTVRAQYWTHLELADLLHRMAAAPRADGLPNNMITDRPPRFTEHPLTIFRANGQCAMIDGRRQTSLWHRIPGRYPVLLIDCNALAPA